MCSRSTGTAKARAGRQQVYGALQKPRAAWEPGGKEDRGQAASPRNRRTAQNTMGGFDKETAIDRITGLQRQVTEMTEERKQLLAESMRQAGLLPGVRSNVGGLRQVMLSAWWDMRIKPEALSD